MKKLITIALLAASAFVAQAQTNIAYRITVNGQNTSWSYDSGGTKKDQARIAGIIYAYGVYTNSLFTASPTNTPLAIGPWLKQQHTVLIDSYCNQKQAADNAAILANITALLTVNTDKLLASDLSALAAIAEKNQ